MADKTEYTVVQTLLIYDLLYEVNKLLDKGWQLQGGVANVNGYACQAMVRTTLTQRHESDNMRLDDYEAP